VLADWLTPFPPSQIVGGPFLPPGGAHLLGTDDVGHDIFSGLIIGARISLLIGIVAGLTAAAVGTLVGVLAGYFGGPVDTTLMRTTDAVLVLPFLPLMIVLAAVIGPTVLGTVLLIALVAWPQTARVVRSHVLSLRNRTFVDSARVIGASNAVILGRYILPLVLPLSVAQFVLLSATAILAEASLSFLGLGDPSAASWGSMLYWAQARGAFLNASWVWWVLPPGIAISITVLAFTLIGSLLEDLLDPRLRRGRAN
jgi:peptide/nickel transport system ATP-binding protein/peptide/nickel transport system permease protein